VTRLFDPAACLPAGLHPGLSMEAYLELGAVGSSFLRAIDSDCPAIALHDHEKPEEAARKWTTQERGTCLHARLLEPARFDVRYVLSFGCRGVLKSGDRAGKFCDSETGRLVRTRDGETSLFCGKHDDATLPSEPRVPVTEAALFEVDEMAAAVRSIAAPMLLRATHREVTAVCIDPETGLPLKARLDLVDENDGQGGTIYDVKALADIAPQRWPQVVWNGGLHIQAAHHLAVARAAGLSVSRFAWLTVRNAAPYLAVLQPSLGESSLDVAEQLWRDRLAVVKQCEQSGAYPGYEVPGSSELPEYVLRQYLVGA